MKKLLVIISSILMAFTLLACGKDEQPAKPEIPSATVLPTEALTPETEPAEEEPTDEDWAVMEEYGQILKSLQSIEENGIEDLVYSQKFLKNCYDQLINLEAVDKWVGTKWGDEAHLDRARGDVLADFTVLEEVLLLEQRFCADPLGNETSTIYNTPSYDKEGRIAQSTPSHFSIGDPDPWSSRSYAEQIITNASNSYGNIYSYDAEGRLEKIQCISYDKVTSLRTFTYENGLCVNEQVLENVGCDGNVTYTYDPQGHITQVVYEGTVNEHPENKYVFTYEYDAQGLLLSEQIAAYDWTYKERYEQKKEQVLTTYTYDQDGLLIGGKCVQTMPLWSGAASSTSEWVYKYDAQGRLAEVSTTYGDQVNAKTGEIFNEAYYSSSRTVFEYGNFYIYNPGVKA